MPERHIAFLQQEGDNFLSPVHAQFLIHGSVTGGVGVAFHLNDVASQVHGVVRKFLESSFVLGLNRGTSTAKVNRLSVLHVVIRKLGKAFVHILNILLIRRNVVSICGYILFIRGDVFGVR